jgi:hypothetical protein
MNRRVLFYFILLLLLFAALNLVPDKPDVMYGVHIWIMGLVSPVLIFCLYNSSGHGSYRYRRMTLWFVFWMAIAWMLGLATQSGFLAEFWHRLSALIVFASAPALLRLIRTS